MDFLFVVEPDPENYAVNFHFYLPNPEYVQFEIFSLLGKRIAQISDGRLPAGAHSVLWSTAQLESDAYLVRFCVRDESIVQRIQLLATA
jgi:hypothetical protein